MKKIKGLLFPKPESKKKKKKTNGWKNKPQRMCYYCGTPGAERHEVFYGPNRQTSVDNGYQVDLCPKCHEAIHKRATEEWIKRDLQWRQHYQRVYMVEQIISKEASTQREAEENWIKLIGRNYL